MSESAKHTPTPWAVDRQYLVRADDGTGVAVASVTQHFTTERGGPLYDEACANAAFIVRAVNAHDALVAALRVARKYVDRCIKVHNEGAKFHIEEIDAALKLADGQQ